MSRDLQLDAVTEYYETHPINEQQIIDKLQLDGVDLASVTEDTLQNYDQDHYGGAAANDALASLAGIDNSCHVLDVCCGLGGPSRYLAHQYGCRVTGIDMTASRIEGAKRLTELVGLDERVSFHKGNALELAFADKTFDVVIAQEAFCHIPSKDRLVAQCVRVLKPGGRLAFSDVLATNSITESNRKRLQHEMTFFELGSQSSYRQQLEREECTAIEVQDMSNEWRTILVDRLAMYRSLKEQTIKRFGEARFTEWDNAYSFFVGLYSTGELGGGRFVAHRPQAWL